MINKGITGLIAGSEMSELSQLTEDELLDFVEKVVSRAKDRNIPVISGAPIRLNMKDLAGITTVFLIISSPFNRSSLI